MGPKLILVGPINFFSRMIDLVSRPFTMPDLNLNHFISIEKIPLPSPFKLLELTFLKGLFLEGSLGDRSYWGYAS